MLPFDINIFPFKTGVYVVGGSVRDLLVERMPYDYDLVVDRDWTHFASRLGAMTGGHIVELGKQNQKMLRVVTEDRFFDIMPVNGSSIENDLRLRDFTINAMALDVSTGNLIDPLGGQTDLAAKNLRMVSREAFRKDPVRLVRAYRMAANFDLDIDQNTQAAITEDASLIQDSAGERIREELFKILQCDQSHAYLSMMDQSGLLVHIFPEFLKLKKLRVHSTAPRTWFEQTLNSYFHLEKLLNPDDGLMQSIDSQFFQHDPVTRSILLKWPALFHNLGRLPAKAPVDNSNINDLDDQAARSAAMAQVICQRLRFSRRQSDTIEMIIRHHFQPMELFRAHQQNTPVEKEFIHLFLNCSDVTPDVLLLALAEFKGQGEFDDSVTDEFTDFIRMLIQKHDTVLRPRAALPPPINGNDLINEFGMKPSAEFRQILKRIEVERLAKESYSRAEALKLVESLLGQKKVK
jgi:tRNA nucleotidyltransferase/poly(A) polymerase